MSFIKAYLHKEYRTKKRWQHLVRCHRLGYSPWNATIPGGLLSSRARFRLMANASKLDPNLYIYNLSEKWGGHTGTVNLSITLSDRHFNLNCQIKMKNSLINLCLSVSLFFLYLDYYFTFLILDIGIDLFYIIIPLGIVFSIYEGVKENGSIAGLTVITLIAITLDYISLFKSPKGIIVGILLFFFILTILSLVDTLNEIKSK